MQIEKAISKRIFASGTVSVAVLLTGLMLAPNAKPDEEGRKGADRLIEKNASGMIDAGRRTFRYDTFGDQVFWGDSLKLHQAIAGRKLGGLGPGVSPRTLCL